MSDAPRKIVRSKTGNFLEHFQPGHVYRHKGGKTVTEGLFSTFTEFSMTTNPLSKNARYARAYGFEGLICPPGLVMLVAFSQTVEDVSENARANLEYIDMRFGAPVYVGDTVEVQTKVLGVRPSSSRPNLGIVHVQSTARKNVGAKDESVVLTWQRKVQVYKDDPNAEVHAGEVEPDEIDCELWLPPYEPSRDYKALAHLSNRDTWFEDLEPGTLIEHSRARTVTDEHIHMTAILDNTSQVHCNQYMIDLNPVADNALGDLVYPTGRHTAPLFAGDTVFAETEIRGKRDHPTREDVGILETTLFGHKYVREEGAQHEDAPAGWKKVRIFELEREIVVKRRSHYAD